jgi:excisionase family DNA binding protein
MINGHAHGERQPLTPTSVSVRQAADLIGLSPPTIWRLIATKRLRSFKLGRKRLVAYDSLCALVLDAADQERAP